jgi:hypothetical protein
MIAKAKRIGVSKMSKWELIGRTLLFDGRPAMDMHRYPDAPHELLTQIVDLLNEHAISTPDAHRPFLRRKLGAFVRMCSKKYRCLLAALSGATSSP